MLLNVAEVRRLRVNRGWSQARLAKEAGVNQSYWSKLERGAGNPRPALLKRVADALGVGVDQIVNGDQP